MSRQNDLAKIHIAKKQLGMDDDTYRAMLRSVAGVDSSAALNPVGMAKILAHLERCGFKPKAKPGKRPSVTGNRAGLIGKIEAQLADVGRPWSYAEGMAKRMFKVEKLDWLDAEQLGKIVAALSYDAKRRDKKAQEDA
jgi:phage gp16-like protein